MHLIDTPGFDDTHRTESSVLQEIVYWLSTAYQPNQSDGSNGFLLNGIIYCQAIAGPRWTGSSTRSLRILQAICGSANHDAVTVVSTFWDIADRNLAHEHEKQLLTSPDMLGPIFTTRPKATHFRQDSGYRSAAKILNFIINRNKKFILQIQRELASPNATLSNTRAGREAARLWEEDIEAVQRRINDARAEIATSTDEFPELEWEIAQYRLDISSSQTALNELALSRHDLLEKWTQRNNEEVHALDVELERCRKQILKLQKTNAIDYLQEARLRESELVVQRAAKIAGRGINWSAVQAGVSGVGVALAVLPLTGLCNVM